MKQVLFVFAVFLLSGCMAIEQSNRHITSEVQKAKYTRQTITTAMGDLSGRCIIQTPHYQMHLNDDIKSVLIRDNFTYGNTDYVLLVHQSKTQGTGQSLFVASVDGSREPKLYSLGNSTKEIWHTVVNNRVRLYQETDQPDRLQGWEIEDANTVYKCLFALELEPTPDPVPAQPAKKPAQAKTSQSRPAQAKPMPSPRSHGQRSEPKTTRATTVSEPSQKLISQEKPVIQRERQAPVSETMVLKL